MRNNKFVFVPSFTYISWSWRFSPLTMEGEELINRLISADKAEEEAYAIWNNAYNQATKWSDCYWAELEYRSVCTQRDCLWEECMHSSHILCSRV